MKKRILLIALFNLFFAVFCSAQTVTTEQTFESVINLPGWTFSNQSNPVGETGWFQGKSGILQAQLGAANSYIAANFNSTGGEQGSPGTICNYMILPDLGELESLSFFSRSTKSSNNFSVFPDRLYVVYSPTGAINPGNCTDGFGDFTETLLVINENLTTAEVFPEGYPLINWERFSVDIFGDGRIAFVYYVEDAGFYGLNSNYIGIDSLRWVPFFPEPQVVFATGFEQ